MLQRLTSFTVNFCLNCAEIKFNLIEYVLLESNMKNNIRCLTKVLNDALSSLNVYIPVQMQILFSIKITFAVIYYSSFNTYIYDISPDELVCL